MRRAEQANPAVFAVERRAQWRTSMDAYLAPDVVAAIFAPYSGEVLTEQHWGKLGTEYVMHVDTAEPTSPSSLDMLTTATTGDCPMWSSTPSTSAAPPTDQAVQSTRWRPTS